MKKLIFIKSSIICIDKVIFLPLKQPFRSSSHLILSFELIGGMGLTSLPMHLIIFKLSYILESFLPLIFSLYNRIILHDSFKVGAIRQKQIMQPYS